MGKGKRVRSKRICEIDMKEIKAERLYGVETSGFYFLKITAIVCMFLWYFSYAFYLPLEIPDRVFLMMQIIGNISYPIFAFLVCESYFHTSNKLKHLLVMFAITIVSEIPYDYVMFEKPFEPKMQNPAGSLTFAFLALILTNINYKNGLKIFYKSAKMRAMVSFFLKIILVGLCGYMCIFLNLEFKWHGLFLVMIFAWVRKSRMRMLFQLIAVALFSWFNLKVSLINLANFMALIPIWIMQWKRSCPTRFVKVDKLGFITAFASSKAVKYTTRYFYPVMFAGMAFALYLMK